MLFNLQGNMGTGAICLADPGHANVCSEIIRWIESEAWVISMHIWELIV